MTKEADPGVSRPTAGATTKGGPPRWSMFLDDGDSAELKEIPMRDGDFESEEKEWAS